MTKDEELKEAREWLDKHIKEHGGYLCDSSALVAYHHHRLETNLSAVPRDLELLLEYLKNCKFGKPAIMQHIIQEIIANLPSLYDKYDRPYNGMPENNPNTPKEV